VRNRRAGTTSSTLWTPSSEPTCSERCVSSCAKAGSIRLLAAAISVSYDTLKHALESNARRLSAGLAVRAARYAEAPLEDLLTGAWPKPGACPMCGRSGSKGLDKTSEQTPTSGET
jgi:hypothetical protein